MDTYSHANLALWNEWAALHEKSEFYDVAGFKQGRCTLKPIEVAEVGTVAGRSLLHLQCHFGLDTLSWARRGAAVTGVDFSDQAIAQAQALSQALNIPARFVCCDLYDLPQHLSGQFDIVFTSYGGLCWLRDIRRWGEIVAHFLKPGGAFHLVEFHPFAYVFDDADPEAFRVRCDYFQTAAQAWDTQGSYADPAAQIRPTVHYEWMHSLGNILNALIAAGLQIECLHEFPFSAFRHFPFMELRPDGWWWPVGQPAQVPLMFSLRAVKGYTSTV